MKKWSILICLTLMLAPGLWFVSGCARKLHEDVIQPRETTSETVPTTQPTTEPVTVPTTAPTTEPTTEPTTVPTTVPTEAPTDPQPVYTFTEEEEALLLKIGMAERGDTGCTQCIALVMRTVLNRVESGRFSATIRGVIYAQDQFTPVVDGSFESAAPSERCREALDWIRYGWDQSQGALYYEWCQGESWHSQNLHLLLQHCDTRFYQ